MDLTQESIKIMKFILKVLVLVCLVVVSKLAKDEALALRKPSSEKAASNAIFINHTAVSRAPLGETNRGAVSIKFEKSALQIN